MKLVYQPLGTVSLVGIESHNKEDVLGQYYSFWNHGATTGKLHEMCDGFYYITTNEKKLGEYFVNSSFHMLLNEDSKRYKKVKGGVMEAARSLGKKRLEELKQNSEVFYSTRLGDRDYSMGKIESVYTDKNGVCDDEEEWKQKSHLVSDI